MRLGAITDEFAPDIETAASAMRAAGLETAELRTVDGKNIADLSDLELDKALTSLHRCGLVVNSISSPLLKCTLPDAPPLDERFQQDVFAAPYAFADQARLTECVFRAALKAEARIVRVFSFWRTMEPAGVFDRVVATLRKLVAEAEVHGLVIGLENEHACNVATARETACVLAALDHPNFGIVWDPANAFVAGEAFSPGTASLIPAHRIVHVHAKDCRMVEGKPQWTALGDGDVQWPAQLEALASSAYGGDINLETHWRGPHDNKLEASQICAAKLRRLVAAL